MDIFEIRQLNLKNLYARLAKDGLRQKDIAVALDLGAAHLSQLMGGKRIGNDVARKIEAAQSLAHGWMDQAQQEQVAPRIAEERATYAASHPLRIDADTIAAALKLVRLTYQNLKMEIDLEANGLPLAHAYEFLIRRRDQTVSAENVIDFSDWLYRKLEGESDDAQTRNSRGISAMHSRQRKSS